MAHTALQPEQPITELSDEELIDELERRIFHYFWENSWAETGIIYDRSDNDVGTIAATGFGLVACCVGAERGWITRPQAYDRVWKTLYNIWDDPTDPDDPRIEGHWGGYWHYIDGRNGDKVSLDCVATCDTADLVAGVLVAGQYFAGTPIEELANHIYDDVEWDRFVLPAENGRPGLISFGWVPPGGSDTYPDSEGLLPGGMPFLQDNSLLVYALALGSATHPIPRETWEAHVDTARYGEYAGYRCVEALQLFCRQVPHAFIRFRRLHDRRIEYYLDMINALLADREFCIQQGTYHDKCWGLSDCFGKHSYTHGAPPGPAINDGTIATSGFVCALPFIPDLAMETIRWVLEHHQDRVWGRYGLVSGLDLDRGYFADTYVGIELGPMLCMLENYRSGLVWDLFMSHPVMTRFVELAEFDVVIENFELPAEAPPYATLSVEGATDVRVADSDAPSEARALRFVAPDSAPVSVALSPERTESAAVTGLHYLACWVKGDVDVHGYLAGRRLETCANVPGGLDWRHLYFPLPEVLSADSPLPEVTFQFRPAQPGQLWLDDVRLTREYATHPPAAVTDLSARTGGTCGSVQLSWTAPGDAGGGAVEFYHVRHSSSPILDEADWRAAEEVSHDLSPADPGQTEVQTVLMDPGVSYHFALRSVDRFGHLSPLSNAASADSKPCPVNEVLDDFAGGLSDRWRGSSVYALSAVETPVLRGERSMRVEYRKGPDDRWAFFEFDITPPDAAMFRFLAVPVYGQINLLAKLWCAEGDEEDVQILASRHARGWTTLLFDLDRARGLRERRDQVRRVLFFVDPGLAGSAGEFYIDEVVLTNDSEYSPERGGARR